MTSFRGPFRVLNVKFRFAHRRLLPRRPDALRRSTG